MPGVNQANDRLGPKRWREQMPSFTVSQRAIKNIFLQLSQLHLTRKNAIFRPGSLHQLLPSTHCCPDSTALTEECEQLLSTIIWPASLHSGSCEMSGPAQSVPEIKALIPMRPCEVLGSYNDDILNGQQDHELCNWSQECYQAWTSVKLQDRAKSRLMQTWKIVQG